MKKSRKQAKRSYSRKLIIDEFTPLNLSRRRKYQLRRVKAGRCVKCDNPPAPNQELCVKHCIEQAIQAQKRRNSRRQNRGKWLDLARAKHTT